MTLRQAIIIIFIFVAICALALYQSCFGADLALSGKIVVPNKARLTWLAPAGDVDGYKVYALSSAGRAVFVVDSVSAALDMSGVGIVGIERVKFCVTAYNSAGESAPSDTVSLPMSSARFLFGDLNHDGKCDVLDSALLWARGMVGSRVGMPNYSAEMDIDADGIIGTKDHVAFIVNLGRKL